MRVKKDCEFSECKFNVTLCKYQISDRNISFRFEIQKTYSEENLIFQTIQETHVTRKLMDLRMTHETHET